MKSLIRNSAITAILLAATAFAQADTYTYSGDTTGGNTFNRPVSLTTLSIVGTNVAYHELDFSVTTAGIYTFLSTTTSYDAPGVRMVVAPIGLVNSGAITGAKIGTIRTRI